MPICKHGSEWAEIRTVEKPAPRYVQVRREAGCFCSGPQPDEIPFDLQPGGDPFDLGPWPKIRHT